MLSSSCSCILLISIPPMHPETNPHFIRLHSQDDHLPGQRRAQQPLHGRDEHDRPASPPPRHPRDQHGGLASLPSPHDGDQRGRPTIAPSLHPPGQRDRRASPPPLRRGDQHGRPASPPPLRRGDQHGRPASPPPLRRGDQHGRPASPPPLHQQDQRGRRASPPPTLRSKIDPSVLPFIRKKPKKSKHPEPRRSPPRGPAIPPPPQRLPQDVSPERRQHLPRTSDDDERRQRRGPAVITPPMQQLPPDISPEHPRPLPKPEDDQHRPHLSPQSTKPMLVSPGPYSPSSGQRQPRRYRTNGPRMPPPEKTNPITWSAAVCCAIFWLIVILGGLIVLIVYLLYRPRSPQVTVSDASLNMAYLDMGFLLNADLTFLANFTNPSKKGVVRFSYVTFELYHGHTLLSVQYVPPFSVAKAQSVLANVHFVSSQVPLSLGEIQRIQQESGSNKIMFGVKGVFRARTHLGSLLRYSYHLYSQCTIVLTSPPNGVLSASRCTSKR